MNLSKIRYRAGYKYQLAADYAVITDIIPAQRITHEYFSLDTLGWLMIRQGYAWDGSSGPACDTKSAMRGSLVHDVLYQMLRLGLLPPEWKGGADREYRRLCLEDGMWKLRAQWQILALRLFGGQSTEAAAEPPVLEAP